MSEGQFLFKPPKRLKSMSDAAYLGLKLASIADRLSLEDRTLVNHHTGRAENVAEHSLMLAFISPIISEKLYPELDANLVARFATIHDVIEAYVGDTPTYDIDAAELVVKDKLEATGLKKLIKDYSDIPAFADLVKQYEAQNSPEARFVRVLDKCMPAYMHLVEGGKTLRSHTDRKGLFKYSTIKSNRLKKEYPDFTELIDLREELGMLIAGHLLNK